MSFITLSEWSLTTLTCWTDISTAWYKLYRLPIVLVVRWSQSVFTWRRLNSRHEFLPIKNCSFADDCNWEKMTLFSSIAFIWCWTICFLPVSDTNVEKSANGITSSLTYQRWLSSVVIAASAIAGSTFRYSCRSLHSWSLLTGGILQQKLLTTKLHIDEGIELTDTMQFVHLNSVKGKLFTKCVHLRDINYCKHPTCMMIHTKLHPMYTSGWNFPQKYQHQLSEFSIIGKQEKNRTQRAVSNDK